MKRVAISKRLRFEVFKRDDFKCVYCGAPPTASALHVDHVIAVANGGTNDPSNLVTACAGCNLGKSDVPLEQRKLDGGTREESERDHAEQIRAYLAAQRAKTEAQNEAAAYLGEYWNGQCGYLPDDFAKQVRGLLKTNSIEDLTSAMDIVAAKGLSNPSDRVRYFFGILRRRREQAEAEHRRRAQHLARVAARDAALGLPVREED